MLIIILIAVAVVLVAAIAITLAVILKEPEDDGLILNNVYAAGVDLSGMTQEEAKTALKNATGNTYTQLDMTVQILSQTLLLSPKDTGARLDVDAVVKAAYNYGRTGSQSDQQKDKNQAMMSSYHVPILQYLNLNTNYIQQQLAAVGETYSTTLSQPTITVTGDRPSMTQDSYDTSVVWQTISVFMGTAEYGLSIDDLYQQILDAYSSNLFHVSAECSVLAPDSVDVDALHAQHCIAPVDAQIDDKYNTTPEVYGYGFDLEAVRTQIASAKYGDTIEIPLQFIRPSITAEDLSGNLFQDLLGEATTTISGSNDLKQNLIQACKDINGLVLKSGDVFSFNAVIGQPTTRGGYRQVQILVDKKLEKVVGGGISQVASTLYIAALKAELTVAERYNHGYAPTFVEPGLDADIAYGSKDLRFTNDTDEPMRVEAVVEGNTVTIRLWGTDDRDYTVEISNEIVMTYEPVTLVQVLPENNPDGHLDGKILVSGIAGYDVITYITYTYSDGTTSEQEYEVGQSHYDKRNQVVVKIVTEVVPEPTEPSEPGDITEPSEPGGITEPSEPEEP